MLGRTRSLAQLPMLLVQRSRMPQLCCVTSGITPTAGVEREGARSSGTFAGCHSFVQSGCNFCSSMFLQQLGQRRGAAWLPHQPQHDAADCDSPASAQQPETDFGYEYGNDPPLSALAASASMHAWGAGCVYLQAGAQRLVSSDSPDCQALTIALGNVHVALSAMARELLTSQGAPSALVELPAPSQIFTPIHTKGVFLTQWSQMQQLLQYLTPELRQIAAGKRYPGSDTARWAADFIDALLHIGSDFAQVLQGR